MKKHLLFVALVAASFQLTAQTAGKVFSGSETGKTFQIGSDKSTDTVLEIIKAYNAKDFAKEDSYSSAEYLKEKASFSAKWRALLKSVNQKPIAILPIKLKGSSSEMVLVKSVEDRVANNGSKQTVNLFELYTLNSDKKLTAIEQYVSIPETNEFGKTSGGKVISSDEMNGRAFQFSNRGEVETIEKLAKAYNAMDQAAMAALFADQVKFIDEEGTTRTITNKELAAGTLQNMKSVEWKLKSIIPIKVAMTDPSSGIIVASTDTRTNKNGTVDHGSLMELFYFNNAGKIDGLEVYLQKIK